MSQRRLILLSPTILLGVTIPLLFSSCVMKRTVTEGGAVVSQGYVVERPLKAMNALETTGPDEDDND